MEELAKASSKLLMIAGTVTAGAGKGVTGSAILVVDLSALPALPSLASIGPGGWCILLGLAAGIALMSMIR